MDHCGRSNAQHGDHTARAVHARRHSPGKDKEDGMRPPLSQE